MLTIDQKQELINDSEECLKRFKLEKVEFIRGYIRMETSSSFQTRIATIVIGVVNRIQSVQRCNSHLASVF